MIRKIIHIDEKKCNGCGRCAEACHEGAIQMANGKAKLVREDFCDGFGDCLPNCPTGAITFEEREAPAYDSKAVKGIRRSGLLDVGNMNSNNNRNCQGSAVTNLQKKNDASQEGMLPECGANPSSRLAQWPCQLKLVPSRAPFFSGANLLIAADCTAYAYANMHERFMQGRTTVIGCPKLDAVDYSEKLTAIFRENDIQSVTVIRMEVPCCGGLQHAAETALRQSDKNIPWQVVTISRDGSIMD